MRYRTKFTIEADIPHEIPHTSVVKVCRDVFSKYEYYDYTLYDISMVNPTYTKVIVGPITIQGDEDFSKLDKAKEHILPAFAEIERRVKELDKLQKSLLILGISGHLREVLENEGVDVL